jgi:hypothetical protein
MNPSQLPSSDAVGAPIDAGAGDHDQPYQFGRRPRADVPYPFNTRQYARLLVLRGRLQDRTDRLRGAEVDGLVPLVA